MGHDSLVAIQAAAARSGYVASNWALLDQRFSSGAAATARFPVDMTIRKAILVGAAAVKAKFLSAAQSNYINEITAARTLAGPRDLYDASVPMAIPITAQDTITVSIDNGNNSEIDHLILMLSREDAKGVSPASYKRIFPMRGTSTTADVAYSWGAKSVTWGMALPNPKATYHILGGCHSAANGCAMRWYNTMQPNNRPTIVSAPSAITATMQKFDSDLVDFQGDQLSTLTVEVLGGSTDNAHEITLLIGEL